MINSYRKYRSHSEEPVEVQEVEHITFQADDDLLDDDSGPDEEDMEID